MTSISSSSKFITENGINSNIVTSNNIFNFISKEFSENNIGSYIYQSPTEKGFEIKAIYISDGPRISERYMSLVINPSRGGATLTGGNRVDNNPVNEYTCSNSCELALPKNGQITETYKKGIRLFIEMVRGIPSTSSAIAQFPIENSTEQNLVNSLTELIQCRDYKSGNEADDFESEYVLSAKITSAITEHIRYLMNNETENNKQVGKHITNHIMHIIKKELSSNNNANTDIKLITENLVNIREENLKKNQELLLVFANNIVKRMFSDDSVHLDNKNKVYNIYGIDFVSEITIPDAKFSNVTFVCRIKGHLYDVSIYLRADKDGEAAIPVPNNNNDEFVLKVIRQNDRDVCLTRSLDRELITNSSLPVFDLFKDIQNLPEKQIKNINDANPIYFSEIEVLIKSVYRLIISTLNAIENKYIDDASLSEIPMKISIVNELTMKGFGIKIEYPRILTSPRYIVLQMDERMKFFGTLYIGHCIKDYNIKDNFTDHIQYDLYLYGGMQITSDIRKMVEMMRFLNPMAGDNGWSNRNKSIKA